MQVADKKVEEWLDAGERVDLSQFHLLNNFKVGKDDLGQKLAEARAPQALSGLKERIVQLARIFSKNYKIKVLPSDDGRWSLGIPSEGKAAIDEFQSGQRATLKDLPKELFEPKAILYNLDDIALAPEARVLARVRHEAGRARMMDYRQIFEGHKLATDQDNLGSSFGLVHLAFEDARVYQREVGASDAAKEKLVEALADRNAEITEKINGQPLVRQLALNLLYGHWLQGQDIPGLSDPRVLEASARLAPTLDKYIFSDSTDDNFELFLKSVWPEVQALEAASIEDETRVNLAQEISDHYEKRIKRERKFRHRVYNGLRRVIGLSPAKIKLRETNEALEQLVDANGGDDLRQALASKISAERQALELANSQLSEREGTVGFLSDTISLGNLGDQERQGLDRILGSCPQPEQAARYARAKSSVAVVQSEAFARELPVGLELKADDRNAANLPRVRLVPAPSFPELEIREKEIDQMDEDPQGYLDPAGTPSAIKNSPLDDAAEEIQATQNAQQIRKALKDRDLQRQGFSPEEMRDYENFIALERSVTGRLEEFLTELLPYLPKRRSYAYGAEPFYSGGHLDKRAVIKGAPIGDYKFYRRREPVDSPDPRLLVTLLIDNSPSMEGTKIQESIKTAIFWGCALSAMNVPFSIKLFGGKFEDIMSFEQHFHDPISRVKVKLIQKCKADWQATNISDPLSSAYNDLLAAQRKDPESQGAIFIISDGNANQGRVGSQLQAQIREIQQKFIVMNFNLSQDQREVSDASALFGQKNVVAPASFAQLPSQAIRVLGGVLQEVFKRGGGIKY